VPYNIRVINKAIPIFSSINVAERLKNKGYQKKLIINGSAIMAEIKVKIRK